MEDCIIKLDRAAHHLRELSDLFFEHEKKYPPNVSAKYADDGTLTDINVSVKSYPKAFSAPLGDVVHNIRTSLDILAVNLVEKNGGDSKGVYFPFAKNEDHLEEIIRLKGFDRAGHTAVETLRKLRPFIGGNDDLRGLHDLDIQDKHHAIIPVSAMVQTPAVEIFDVDFDRGGAKVRIVPGSAPEVRPVFPEGGPFAGEGIVETLNRLLQHVTDVVHSFGQVNQTLSAETDQGN